MSTEYSSSELRKRERLIVCGVAIMSELVKRLSEKDCQLPDLFAMSHVVRYCERVGEEVPTLKSEI